MNTIYIDSFEKYLKEIEEVTVPRPYFRGQAKRVSDGFVLVPSLGRPDFKVPKRLSDLFDFECRVLDTFANHVIGHVNHIPRNDWEMLALAQHHGLPTRFMDWTTNPLVALYFACRNAINGSDSAVYILTKPVKKYSDFLRYEENKHRDILPVGDSMTEKVHDFEEEDPYDEYELGSLSEKSDLDLAMMSNLQTMLRDAYESEKQSRDKSVAKSSELTKEEVASPFDISENIIYDPAHVSPRIRAQDGVLLACHRPLTPIDEDDYIEYVIEHKKDNHRKICKQLEQYGVFDKQLFPDLDGMAKWLKYKEFENGL
ncbi:FRG domain-containing protein [Marinoscillum pacificum]|uniref:FRG domain-containing protein n=1 Tax=Marinoscillum pacificum TaxID=392723 RepID=UPI0021580524|nr:FRG domain-containing protein [Marinoscillum pacificum]